MRGQESEAYEIDALVRRKLAELGFYEDSKEEQGVIFSHKDNANIRAIIKNGERSASIVSYGSCEIQVKESGQWRTVQSLGKRGFAYGDESIGNNESSHKDLGPKPPSPF